MIACGTTMAVQLGTLVLEIYFSWPCGAWSLAQKECKAWCWNCLWQAGAAEQCRAQLTDASITDCFCSARCPVTIRPWHFIPETEQDDIALDSHYWCRYLRADLSTAGDSCRVRVNRGTRLSVACSSRLHEPSARGSRVTRKLNHSSDWVNKNQDPHYLTPLIFRVVRWIDQISLWMLTSFCQKKNPFLCFSLWFSFLEQEFVFPPSSLFLFHWVLLPDPWCQVRRG